MRETHPPPARSECCGADRAKISLPNSRIRSFEKKYLTVLLVETRGETPCVLRRAALGTNFQGCDSSGTRNVERRSFPEV